MIVWGGYNGNPLNTGGKYNPNADSWTATNPANAPEARLDHTTVWIGSEMIDGAEISELCRFKHGGKNAPGTDSWTATSTTNAPDARTGHTAVGRGNEMVVWGGFNISIGFFNTGGKIRSRRG